eukprot:CAMPEP_0196660302 /NCGR_PEP_ID=MMETSP1086-20130531/39054_1 /TAXON_ID=77921 /ORGANISM="Cyanoptyche  gloeocystis , Strain SAG4.97" /LENGTH=62 /DNA_ID=CAMNT_0041994635 /DNA_START=222 /DNA_END=407 /DNA_ORIENTATION=-
MTKEENAEAAGYVRAGRGRSTRDERGSERDSGVKENGRRARTGSRAYRRPSADCRRRTAAAM